MSDGFGNVIRDEFSETIKEVKQQVLPTQNPQKKPSTQQHDPKLAQLAQQDKLESSQKEAAIQRELAMMAHHSASGLGITREQQQPEPEEMRPQKPMMSAPILPGSKNRNPLDTQLATTKRESRDSKAVG